MRKMYSKIFKNLIKSYENGTFNKEINTLIQNETDKDDLCKVISSLCGVELKASNTFILDLKNAIEDYSSQHKVVNKIKPCTMDCMDKSGKTLCQKACPFNAILINKQKHTTYIDSDKCTDCGFCVEACPKGGILDKVEFIPLLNLLKNNTPVIVAVAPAISGQFGKDANIYKLRTAFKKLGFTDMIEVAFFADMLTIKEACEFDHFVNNKQDLMITSCCCPMWVAMLKRIYKDLVKYVSPSISPMIAAGRVIKKLNTECKVVFIGPCIAKKAEAKDKSLAGAIDFVLTFTELKDIFESFNINVENLQEDKSSEYASLGGRLYARTGGVSKAISDTIKVMFPEKFKLLKTAHAEGVKECKSILEKVKNKEVNANFIEGMGCIGGCVGGPKAIVPKEEGTHAVNSFAEQSQIKIPIESDCMHQILNKLNITSNQDFKDKQKIQIFERDL